MSTPFFMRPENRPRKEPSNKEPSNRGKEWSKFSAIVAQHIEGYTVPQYGDAPHDQASGFSEQDIVANIRRYVNRMETGARGPVEAQRDLLKIAHYCALLYFKRQDAN